MYEKKSFSDEKTVKNLFYILKIYISGVNYCLKDNTQEF